MTTLSAHECKPESDAMPARKSAPLTLKTILATSGIIVAIIAGGIGLWEGHDNKVASATRDDERNKQTAIDLARQERVFKESLTAIEQTFDRAMTRVENSVGTVNGSLSELSKIVARLEGKVSGLADRVDSIERCRNP